MCILSLCKKETSVSVCYFKTKKVIETSKILGGKLFVDLIDEVADNARDILGENNVININKKV